MKSDQKYIELKRENEILKENLQRKTEELSFFIDAGKALTSTLEFKKVLKIIIDKAKKLIKCETWSLLLVDELNHELYVELAKDKRNKYPNNYRLKVGEGVAGWVAKSKTPLIIPDIRKDKRFLDGYDKLKRIVNVRSVLSVPIINKKKTIGVLEMINKNKGDTFEQKDLDLLLKLIDHAAIAIERSYLYQKMADLAVTDDLTKLFNYRYLDQTLDIEIKRCQRYSSTLSLIFLDMDFFKVVNDSHGHLMGSRLLIEVAQVLIANLRDVDIIARYGGDEFVVVLPETDIEMTHEIAERIQQSISDREFLKEEGLKIRISASFGIAGYPKFARNKKELISLADNAMYIAKNNGRNKICIANKSNPDRLKSK
ncbi:MAG: diguanylate cyclase [Nitrospirota bacterium]